MQVNDTTPTPPISFRPFQITLSIDTEDEAARLHALFNFNPVCKWLNIEGHGGAAYNVRRIIEENTTKGSCDMHVKFCSAIADHYQPSIAGGY